MTELNYLDITKASDGHIKVPSIGLTSPAITESIAKTALASFADGAGGFPFRVLKGYINPVQSGSGDPSPSNVRPITGWTGMNVTRTGKNLLNVTESGATSSQRCTMTGTEGDLTFTSTGNYARVGFSISNLTVGNTYTFSCKAQKTATSGKSSVIYLGTSDWTYNIATLQVSPNGGRDTGDEVSLTKTFTASSSTFFFGVYVTADTGSGDVVKVKDAMLESGGSDTTYELYKGTTYPISWQDEAGTVYGGTLDVTTGLLTVTHGIYVFSGSEVWEKQVSYAKYYSISPNSGYFVRDTAKLPTDNNSSVPILTSIGSFNQPYNGLQNYPYTMCIAADGRIGIHETLYGLMEGVQLVYELATPTTYQLTPTEVLSILGTNNVWCDTGDIEATYIADTKLYIDSKL